MPKIQEVCDYLDEFAPTRLAEKWDNVGLLAGDAAAECERIMTCLTVTPASAAEAINQQVSLIVSHHPLPFHPLKRLTTDSTPSRLVWELARANVAIYSPHTGFDSALEGVNQSLAEKIGVVDAVPMKLIPDDPQQLGAGRVGMVQGNKQTLDSFAKTVKDAFGKEVIKVVGEPDSPVSKVAVACGSGGSFLEDVISAGCDAFVTGEATFHTCLEAHAKGINLVLLGHYDSERFAIEMLAKRLEKQFGGLTIWPSAKESDPIRWMGSRH